MLFLISSVIISICIYHIRKERDSPKGRFLKHIVLYLTVATSSRLGSLVIDYYYNGTGSNNRDILLDYMICIISAVLDIWVLIVRMLEPNIRSYLKDCWVYYRLKAKFLTLSVTNRSYLRESILIDRPTTNLNVLFEDLKLEAIEYQLIAVSLIFLRDYLTLPTIAINQT